MTEAAVQKSRDLDGKMYVYCGPPFTGKSTAGKQLIRQIRGQKGDNYPSVYVDVSEGDLYRAFREKLSVPQNMKDDAWLTILFSHLSNKIVHNPEPKLFGWKFPFCGNELETVPATYRNGTGVVQPIIVIDQLSSLDLCNYQRLKKVYQLASDNRVLVYILTDQENSANLIAGMNGDLRVTPVPRRYDRVAFATQQVDATVFGGIPGIRVATGITWTREEWTREKQHDHVLHFFPNEGTPANVAQDGFFTFLIEGENPTQAMNRANAHFNTVGVDHLVM